MIASARDIASGLRRLRGQYATPPGFDRAVLAAIDEQGLATFREWPSGHWHITDAGNCFLEEQQGGEG